jgi:hypothetical protein
MAFGQASGPPATGRQIQQLEALIHEAGHDGFRDARGPLGLSQRQAGGRFTRDEADELIARLQAQADADPDQPSVARPVADHRETARVQALRAMPAEALAAELQRRGWVVLEP